MSTSTTTNLGLILDNADEPVKTHHRHANENLATLDVTIKSLQDAMDNAKELLGQLGIDADDHYAVDAETARTTLGVPSISDVADIVRENVPLMSPTTRGVAKLDEHGGLVLRDEKLGIGSLVQESDGAVRGGLAEVTAEGHAEQLSTTGKNLLDISGAISQSNRQFIYVPVAPNTTYTFSKGSLGRFMGMRLGIHTYNSSENDVYDTGWIQITSTSFTCTTRSDAVKLGVIVSVSEMSTTVTTNDTEYTGTLTATDLEQFQLQCELGSTATEYEPYTGGAPSPSPDYPQEIMVTNGRNLFDPNGIAMNCYINGGGVLVETPDNRGIVLPVEPNTTYTIRGNIVNTGTEPDDWRIGEFSEMPVANARSLAYFFSSELALLRTFTTNPDTKYLFIKYGNVARSNPEATKQTVQLERGSIATPYVPYGYVGLEVENKNLLDESTLCHLNTTNSNTLATNSVIISYIARVSRNTQYVFSCAGGANRAGVVGTISYPAVGVSYTDLTGTVRTIDSNSFTFTTGEQDYVLLKVGASTTIVKPQLELGTEATPYEPYYHTTTPIPLPSRGWVGSLPDGTADVLTLNGAGKVEWEENVGIWHGADVDRDNIGFDWVSNVHMFRISAAFNHGVSGYDATLNVLANRARNDVKASVMTNAPRDNTLVAIGGTNYLYFSEPSMKKGVTTKQQIVDWLQEMELYLPIATPIIEDCGYINMPAIEGDCIISIPELDALGVKYFVDDSAEALARQWYDRAYAEIGESVVELAQRVAALES